MNSDNGGLAFVGLIECAEGIRGLICVARFSCLTTCSVRVLFSIEIGLDVEVGCKFL